jgi:hypothetical protein
VSTEQSKRWGIAWVSLTLALALHVADEALTGFLPVWNSLVEAARETYGWVPLPTFDFAVWLAGLVIGVLVLLGLAPLAFSGKPYLRPLAYFLGVLMVFNALAHIGASIYWGQFAPGVISSPVLMLAALFLLVTTRRMHRS